MTTKKSKVKTDPKPDERMGLPSASDFPALELCPGKHLAAQGLESEPNEYAESGTSIHSVLEGKTEISELSDADQRTAHEIMDIEASIVDEYHFQHAQRVKEDRVFFNGPDMLPKYSGKPDAVLLNGPVAMLIEYKTGWTSVGDVKTNKQLWANIALTANYYSTEKVIAVLIHPHLRKTFQVQEFGADEIGIMTDWSLAIANEAINPNAPRRAGSKQCQWCDAKATCPEHIAWIQEAGKAGKPISDQTPEERGDRVRQLKMLAKRLKWELECYSDLLKSDPDAIEGFRMIKVPRTEFQSTERAFNGLKDAFGIDAAMHAMTLSVAKAINWLKKAKSMDAKTAKERLCSLCGIAIRETQQMREA
jgi:hypothetical protein